MQQALERVVALCQAGFASYDPSNYVEIEQIMLPYAGADEADKIMRLAKAGPTLSSKRFAYPHIEAIAREAMDAPSQA